MDIKLKIWRQRDASSPGSFKTYDLPGINSFAAFPLFYKYFVTETGTFTLEQAVQKTSTMAARVHNLEGRGTISEGSYADIVLMDLPGLKIEANEIEPRKYPEGIEYVIVNGVPVVEEGVHSGATPGKARARPSGSMTCPLRWAGR